MEQQEERRQWRSDRHKEPKNTLAMKAKKIVLSLGIVAILALITYTVILYGGKVIVDEEKLVLTAPTTIVSKDDEVIWNIFDEYRIPVSIEEIPKHVQEAFIAIEDKRFYSHSGVDFRSIMRAIYRDIIARSKVEGASTITQQLAKNLFLTNDKSWLRKTKEAMIALYLEREFTKDEILEMYLNVIYFGQGQYGVEAAANKFFSKSVNELSLEEAALFAGIVKGPNGYSPIDEPEKALERRNITLNAMEAMGYITVEEKSAAQSREISLEISESRIKRANHTFIDLTIREAEEVYGLSLEQLKNKGYKIITSIEPFYQKVALEQFENGDYFPGNTEGVEGAFVMMDEATGEIVAALGGREFEMNDLNRVLVRRQPGSTMKPIAVYGPAMMTDNFGPYSMLPDQLTEWDGHAIRNSDDEYSGSVSFYDALRFSKNAPSAWLLNEIGIDYAKSYLEKMNMDIEDKGVSIALGGLKDGLTPLQLVESYRTFIHGGEMIEGHTIVEIQDANGMTIEVAEPLNIEVFSAQTAWNMTEMLIDTVASGTAKSGDFSKALAGKTGSTQHPHSEGHYKDAWFVGYTPQYVTALWMGYDQSDENHYLTGGSSYPTVLTKRILSEIDNNVSLAASFTKPEEVLALEQPIDLPVISDVSGAYVFGGIKLVKGKLTWGADTDKRIIYRIYKEKDGTDERIGEVKGDNEFIIENVSLIQRNSYYIVPYDPLTSMEGERSNSVQLTF